MTSKRAEVSGQTDLRQFWLEKAKGLHWSTFPETVYDDDRDEWFPDGALNTCHNAVDRHVAAGRGDETALIYESPVTGRSATFTFAELLDRVARVAGMLREAGVCKGDRVIIYMPMVPEAAFAMLACARIGAVHSVVFGGFAAPELAKRIDDCKPVLVLSASCGFEPGRTIGYKPLLDSALDLAVHQPARTIILQREEQRADLRTGRDFDWSDAYDSAQPVGCVDLASTDPLYILYTSGTTGLPKGVVRDNGGHATALHWSMQAVYGIDAGDTFWAASDIGWVVGHSYIVYGPLLRGAATVLFEGKPVQTPDAGVFWRLIERHKVKALFTAPTAIRAIRRSDPDGSFIKSASLDSLEVLFLAGERADPDTVDWIAERLGKPVIDHWWQTELGWPAIATCVGLGETTIRVGSAGQAVPGYRFEIKDDNGTTLGPEMVGNLLIQQPLPPGAFRRLWNNQARYDASFEEFPGYYLTGDAGIIDEDGFIYIMGRTDDIINVAGHRLSTAQMEEVATGHRNVIECAVVGASDEMKGEVPVIFVVSRSDCEAHEQFHEELVTNIRETIGPIASPRNIYQIDALPKTRSGKILRNLLRDIVNKEPVVMPQTIEDPSVVGMIEMIVRR